MNTERSLRELHKAEQAEAAQWSALRWKCHKAWLLNWVLLLLLLGTWVVIVLGLLNGFHLL